MKPTMQTACSPTAGPSTARWPTRSMRRAISGADTALTNAKVAETAPATPYRPVLPATSRTIPSGTIAIGIRATNAATENRSPPGVESRLR